MELVLVVLALIGGILIGIAVGRRMGHEAGYRDGAWDQATLPGGTRYLPPNPSDSAGA